MRSARSAAANRNPGAKETMLPLSGITCPVSLRHPCPAWHSKSRAMFLPPLIPSPARGRAVRGKLALHFRREMGSRGPAFLSSPPAGRGGGEGRVRGADGRICGAAHLTFPGPSWAEGSLAPGPLPLPPEGRRGALPRTPSCRILRFRLSWRRCSTEFDSPDSPARKAGIEDLRVPAVALDSAFAE